jgi:predicted TIM-barrel fold metal-dependent hydrolase
MLSRRDLLIAAGAACTAELVRPLTTVFAHASQPSTPVDFAVPPDACDCHTHIFGDPRRFPFTPDRVYTPETASVAETRALHKALHITRIVVVQPTVYGTDNSCTIDAIRQLAPNSRGAVMIDEKTTDAALTDMDHAGIRAIRINLETLGQADPSAAGRKLHAAIDRIKGSKWHIEIYTRLSVIEGIKDEVLASPVPVSFDHFGGAQAALGVKQPGFGTLLDLLRSGKAYVKISAAYRASTKAPDYPDVAPLAKALIAANPQRVVWGTDWPHPKQIKGRKPTDVTPLWQIDDGRIFNLLPTWAPDPNVRKTILVENPARLYGF